MPDTCRSFDSKEIDLGGCRCQALMIAGDAAKMDPVCRKSPDHARVAQRLEEAMSGAQTEFTFRRIG